MLNLIRNRCNRLEHKVDSPFLSRTSQLRSSEMATYPTTQYAMGNSPKAGMKFTGEISHDDFNKLNKNLKSYSPDIFSDEVKAVFELPNEDILVVYKPSFEIKKSQKGIPMHIHFIPPSGEDVYVDFQNVSFGDFS